MKKKVAILCELKERELQFLSILKLKLEYAGFNAQIIPQRIFPGIKLLLFRPDIIIINGLRSDSSFYKQILIPKITTNCHVISLYSEQIGRIEGIADTYNNPTILNSIDAHVVWGEGFAEGLKNLGVPSHKIWVIGSMALDLPFFIREKTLSDKNNIAIKYEIEGWKKWVLISDNIIRKADQISVYDEIRREFNSGIKILASNLTDVLFIFRPHPDNMLSDLKFIKDDFSNFKNIKIIREEHNITWSILCNAMIVWRSTSAIEAWATNIQTFGLQTNENKFDYWHEKLMPNFRNANELCKTLILEFKGDFQLNPDLSNNRTQYIKRWFHRNDGRSFDRLTYLVRKIENDPKIKLQLRNYNILDILRAYFNDFISVFSKVIKGEYSKFSISSSDIADNLKYIKLDSNRYDISFEIVNEVYGNYMIEK